MELEIPNKLVFVTSRGLAVGASVCVTYIFPYLFRIILNKTDHSILIVSWVVLCSRPRILGASQ